MTSCKHTLPSWLRKYGLFIALLLAGVSVLAVGKDSKALSAKLVGYNYMQQSIYYFTVNDAMGSNLVWGEPEGGGAISCCAEITGNSVHVKWAMSGTLEEVMAKIPPKVYEKEITLPPRPEKQPRFLEVHFFSLQEIKLRWADWPGPPLKTIQPSPEFIKEKAEEKKSNQEKLK